MVSDQVVGRKAFIVIIVLEGPDLAGKSTVARLLMDEGRSRELLKKGPPTNDSILEQYLRPLDERVDELQGDKLTIVLDRWHIGELVYGPLLRDRSMLSTQQADYIDMVLQSFGCAFFHITAPLPVLEDRYDIRGDALIKKRDLLTISDHFELQLKHRPHWVTYAPTYANLSNIPWHPKNIGGSPRAGAYIGPSDPKVLLLGDQRNDQRFIFPFVPERASSGHWLMGAMHMAGINHMQVGIMNACEIEPRQLFAQWWVLGRPPVVCLGNNAWRQWSIAHADADSVAIKMKHPQWMRRFAYTAMKEYGQEIKEEMRG